MLKRELLLAGCAIALMLSGQEANAAEACTKVPTCEELGYTQTTCGEQLSLKCPFDQTKLFCGSTYKPCGTGYARINGTCVLGDGQVIYSGNTPIGVGISSHVAIAMRPEMTPTGTNTYTTYSATTVVEAKAKCQNKTDGGKKWRLPAKDELLALINPQLDADYYNKINATLASRGGIPLLTGMPLWVTDDAIVRCSDSSCQYVPLSSTTNPNLKYPVRCVFSF